MKSTKLDFVVKKILEAKEIIPRGQDIIVYLNNVLLDLVNIEELHSILLKLQNDEKVLAIKEFPSDLLLNDVTPLVDKTVDQIFWDGMDTTTRKFIVETNDTFDIWYAKYLSEHEESPIVISQPRDTKMPVEQDNEYHTDSSAAPTTEKVYWVTFTISREIVLNDVFVLSRPDFDRENEYVFNYLYENPNQKFTKNDIENKRIIKLIKSFHKIIENLGFKGDLKKVFFDVSNYAIRFKNPVTRQDLKQLGIQYIKLH